MDDDDVVGHARVPMQFDDEYRQPVHFRDLDKHIQDRLRAAEQMAEPLRAFANYACPPDYHTPGVECQNCRAARTLAAYEATFKGGRP